MCPSVTFVPTPSLLSTPCLPGLPLSSFDPGVMNDAALKDGLPAEGAAKLAKQEGVAVFYNDQGSGSWKPCNILSTAKGHNKYQIEWQDTRRRQIVMRLHLMAKTEKVDAFAKRVSVAVRARRNAASFLRYNLYIDNMPFDGNPELNDGQIYRIKGSALNTVRLAEMEASGMWEELMGEVTSEYARCINKIVFDEALKEKDFGKMLEHLALPKKGGKAPAPYLATIHVPPYQYSTVASEFQEATYNDLGEVILAMQNVRTECNKVLDTTLFVTDLLKAMEVSEFNRIQAEQSKQSATMLKRSWIDAVKNGISDPLANFPEGHYMFLGTKDKLAYEKSKLKRFLNTVNYVMENTLRLLTESTLQSYADFIRIATAFDVKVKGTKDIEQTYQHPFNPSITDRPPLFTLELGPVDGAFGFSTSVDEFEATPVASFTQALEMLHEVPQVESSVLRRLFLGKQKFLFSVKVCHCFHLDYCQSI